jgi:hypothetical protein
MNKKEKKKREKRMTGFMTAKSTAKLAEEMKKVLDLEIPDPEEIPAWISNRESTPRDARADEENLIDEIDKKERSKTQHEGAKRGR